MTDAEVAHESLSCACCGADVVENADGTYSDGSELKCSDCGATNHVSCDEGDEDGEFDVYFSFYVCRHGRRDEEMCDLCEIEEGGGISEVAT